MLLYEAYLFNIIDFDIYLYVIFKPFNYNLFKFKEIKLI